MWVVCPSAAALRRAGLIEGGRGRGARARAGRRDAGRGSRSTPRAGRGGRGGRRARGVRRRGVRRRGAASAWSPPCAATACAWARSTGGLAASLGVRWTVELLVAPALPAGSLMALRERIASAPRCGWCGVPMLGADCRRCLPGRGREPPPPPQHRVRARRRRARGARRSTAWRRAAPAAPPPRRGSTRVVAVRTVAAGSRITAADLGIVHLPSGLRLAPPALGPGAGDRPPGRRHARGRRAGDGRRAAGERRSARRARGGGAARRRRRASRRATWPACGPTSTSRRRDGHARSRLVLADVVVRRAPAHSDGGSVATLLLPRPAVAGRDRRRGARARCGWWCTPAGGTR